MNNAQFAENLEKQLHDDIVKEPDTDTTFIYNMSKQDFIAAGLNEGEKARNTKQLSKKQNVIKTNII